MGLGSGIRDPGSEIRDPEKTYSGSRIQGSKRHRIPDPGSGSATLLPALHFSEACDIRCSISLLSSCFSFGLYLFYSYNFCTCIFDFNEKILTNSALLCNCPGSIILALSCCDDTKKAVKSTEELLCAGSGLDVEQPEEHGV